MVKPKTLTKQTKSTKNIKKPMIDKSKLIPYNPTENILDRNRVSKAILECLENNDPEGVIEILSIYLNTLNKVKSAQEASLSRSTLYHSLKKKNPTIKTLAKLVHASTMDSRK